MNTQGQPSIDPQKFAASISNLELNTRQAASPEIQTAMDNYIKYFNKQQLSNKIAKGVAGTAGVTGLGALGFHFL